MLKIITYPNPILKQRAAEIADFSDSGLKQLVLDMTQVMVKSDGIGLAAPQIGKSIRLVIIMAENKPIAMFNPRIISRSLFKEWGEEGCLSVPGIYGHVKRSKNIAVEYQNERGDKKTLKTDGMTARIVQHELDHLDGIIFIEKAKKLFRLENPNE